MSCANQIAFCQAGATPATWLQDWQQEFSLGWYASGRGRAAKTGTALCLVYLHWLGFRLRLIAHSGPYKSKYGREITVRKPAQQSVGHFEWLDAILKITTTINLVTKTFLLRGWGKLPHF